MDNIFLKEIVTCYIADHNLEDKHTDNLYNYLINTRNNLRNNHTAIFEYIHYDYDRVNQQKLCYEILDDYLTEFGLISAAAVLGGSVALIAGLQVALKKIDAASASVFGKLNVVHNKIRDWLKSTSINRQSGEYAARYHIIDKLLDKEYSNCASMCGIDIKTGAHPATVNKYSHALFEPHRNYLLTSQPTIKEHQEIQCLVVCYLDYVTSSIAELHLLYKGCLERTGEAVPGDFSSMTKINPAVGSDCHTLREDIDDLKGQFKGFLDKLYNDDPRTKATWINILEQKISEAMANKKITSYSPFEAPTDVSRKFISFNTSDLPRSPTFSSNVTNLTPRSGGFQRPQFIKK